MTRTSSSPSNGWTDLSVDTKILANDSANVFQGNLYPLFKNLLKKRYYFPRLRYLNYQIFMWVNNLTIVNANLWKVSKIDRQLPKKTFQKKSQLNINDPTSRQNSSNSRRSTAWRLSCGHRSTFISSRLFSHRYANSLSLSFSPSSGLSRCGKEAVEEQNG